MKKLTALLLALVMMFALCACGQTTTVPADTSASTTTATDTATDTTSAISKEGKRVLIMNQHNSKESLNGQFTQMFVDYVNEHSDTMYVDVYYNGELGGIQETLEGAIMGTINIGGCSFAQLATFYPDMEVWSMPYLVTSAEEAEKIIDLENNTLLAEMIETCNEKAGLTIIGATYSSDARQLTCNFPVYTPADLAGAKIRCITNPVYTMCIKGMGGTPVPIDWTETIAALTTGTVVGQENPYSTLVSYQMWDCQDYIMETSHIFDINAQYCDTDTWNALTEDERQILRDAVAYQNTESNKVLQENIENYKATCVENGMTIITEADGLDLAAFKAGVDALKETEYPQYKEYFDYITEYLAS